MLAYAYASAGVSPGDAALEALWARAAALAPSLPGHALATLAAAAADLRCGHVALLRRLAGSAAQHLTQAELPRHQRVAPAAAGVQREAAWLSSLVCALGRLGVSDARLMQLACRRARALLQASPAAAGGGGAALGGREAVPLLWGLAALCRPPSAAWAAATGRAAETGAAAPAGWVPPLCPPDVVWGLAAAAEAGIVAEVVRLSASGQATAPADALRDEAEAGSQLDGGLLSMYLSACVGLRHRPAAHVLEAACAALLRRLPGLSSHVLCDVAWALANLAPPPPAEEREEGDKRARVPPAVGFADLARRGPHVELPFRPPQPAMRTNGHAAAAVPGAGAAAVLAAAVAVAASAAREQRAAAREGAPDRAAPAPRSTTTAGGHSAEQSAAESAGTSAEDGDTESAPSAGSRVAGRWSAAGLQLRWAAPAARALRLSQRLRVGLAARSFRAASGTAQADVGTAAPVGPAHDEALELSVRSPLKATKGLPLCEDSVPQAPRRAASKAVAVMDGRASPGGPAAPQAGQQQPSGVVVKLADGLQPSPPPPEHLELPGGSASSELLQRCLQLLTDRLCGAARPSRGGARRGGEGGAAEVLVLESLVRLTWAMAVRRVGPSRCEPSRCTAVQVVVTDVQVLARADLPCAHAQLLCTA
jgi:hypothetical protein